MPTITLTRKHSLERKVVRARVEEIARGLQKELNAHYAWNGDSLQFSRSGASGTISISEESVQIDVKLSAILSPVKSKIEGAIRERFESALGDDVSSKLA